MQERAERGMSGSVYVAASCQDMGQQLRSLQQRCVAKAQEFNNCSLQQELEGALASLNDVESAERFMSIIEQFSKVDTETQSGVQKGCALALSCFVSRLAEASDRAQSRNMEQHSSTLGDLATRLGVASEGFLRQVKSVAKHAELVDATLEVGEYPNLDAFQAADKNDVIAKKLLTACKACNSQAASVREDFSAENVKKLLSVREKAWSALEAVVQKKQAKVDASLKDLTAQLEDVAGGLAGGTSWKSTLGSTTPTFEEVTEAAKVLWQGKKGVELQQLYKKLSQALSLQELLRIELSENTPRKKEHQSQDKSALLCLAVIAQ